MTFPFPLWNILHDISISTSYPLDERGLASYLDKKPISQKAQIEGPLDFMH